MSTDTSFSFGSFNYFCNQVSLPLCPVVGPPGGIEPKCYSRNVEISGTLIFQPATLVIQVIALIMTAIMIYHIKSKYTAVGRKEIVMFFYLYVISVILEFLLVSNIIPTSAGAYKYFAAIHAGVVTATFCCLLMNGFVGFQWAEDGTPMSLWSIRIACGLIFAITFFIAIGTFTPFAGLSPGSPTVLFVIYICFNAAFLIIYIVLQIVLVLNTLDDRWPLGDILFGTLFYFLGRIFEFVLSTEICELAKHYIDGYFFGTICTLLGVMMVYKYWDSITKEDLEFSVGGKSNVWEVRDPLLSDDAMMQVGRDYAALQQQQQVQRTY